jgi:hypothetical protein
MLVSRHFGARFLRRLVTNVPWYIQEGCNQGVAFSFHNQREARARQKAESHRPDLVFTTGCHGVLPESNVNMKGAW